MPQIFWNFSHKVFRFLASLELAVTNILVLAVVLAIGTVYESKYSAAVASQVVYRSVWMQILLWLFVMNLSASAISRLPWKRHHIAFLVTHLGIIVLLVGSWITQQRGIDGSLAVAPGEIGKYVSLPENMLNVFRAVPGQSYELLLSERLDLDQRRPLQKPLSFKLRGNGEALTVAKYYPHSARSVRAKEEAIGKGVPAMRFSLKGSRAEINEWFFLQGEKGNTKDLGPARIRFQKEAPKQNELTEQATLFVYPVKNQKVPALAVVVPRTKKIQNLGLAEVGKDFPLGWMDFSFRLEEYFASASPEVEYQELPAKAGMEGLESIEVAFGKEKVWLELGASAQISEGDSLYYLQYTRKQVPIGFDLHLKEFQIGYYEGTTRPKSYSSIVTVADQQHTISMNEPLKQNGFTFYQASYELDEAGTPRYSVFSVNYDPGRWVKYLGSLMLTLGIILMFYFRPKYTGTNQWLMKKPESAENP